MKIVKLSLICLLLFLFSNCIHIVPPRFGTVKDAETGKPLEGVVVHMDVEEGSPLILGKYLAGSYVTLTNKNGNYYLLGRYKILPPFFAGTDSGLSFIKVGYFPSKIPDPVRYNTVPLYPIKYFLDYSRYRKAAKNGSLDPYGMARNPKAFVEYRNELHRIASMELERVGDKGIFIESPGAQFTKLYCTTEYTLKKNSEPSTYGIFGNVCVVFDEASHKWLTFDTQGNTQESKDSLLSKYKYYCSSPEPFQDESVYANDESIYIPRPPHLSNLESKIKPLKGGISALAGSSSRHLTIENSGYSLCYYSTHGLGKGCASAKNIFPYNETGSLQHNRFIAIAHGDSSYSPEFYAISSDSFAHRLHKVLCEKNPSTGKIEFSFPELSPSFPAHDEIIDFDWDRRLFFIAFRNAGLRKYYLDRHGKGPLKEDKNFYKNSNALFERRTISAVEIGRSVRDSPVVYVTVGNSAVYRLSEKGIPDFRLKIRAQ